MTPEADLVRRFQQECMHPGIYDQADQFLHEDLQIHPIGTVPPGREHAIAWFQSFLASFKTEQFDVIDMVTSSPYVYQMLELTFRHIGEYQGIPATQTLIRVPGSAAFKVTEDRITDHWGIYEFAVIDRALGVHPR